MYSKNGKPCKIMKFVGHVGHNVNLMCAVLLVSVASRCTAIVVLKIATQVQKGNCVMWCHETKSAMAMLTWFQKIL
jgi:hypothetical protein